VADETVTRNLQRMDELDFAGWNEASRRHPQRGRSGVSPFALMRRQHNVLSE
jgi:hypothetical protein